jgi:hypothetical protein
VKLLWLLRRAAKRLVILARLGDRLIEYCEVCGIRQPLVWWSPNELWSELTGERPVKGDNMPGVICPRCFDDRAHARGILLQWHPTVIARR